MSGVETVLGYIDKSELGFTHSHEHIYLDLDSLTHAPKDPEKLKIYNAPFNMEIISDVKNQLSINKDNIDFVEVDTVIKELREFKSRGGGTVACLDLPGIGRNIEIIKEVSIQSQLNIIVATGWYIQESHPEYVKHKSVDELAEIMITELKDGIEGTNIKAGVIGECACSEPVPWHPEEKKVLTAACKAQVATDSAFTIHPSLVGKELGHPPSIAETYVDLLDKEGVDKNKFYLSHSDQTCFDRDYHVRLLDRGITLDFDTIGLEYYLDDVVPGYRVPTDPEREAAIENLCTMGYDKQLMLSQDVFSKLQLKKYGGYGYSHIIKTIIPRLLYRGVSKKQIRNMTIENPKRIFTH